MTSNGTDNVQNYFNSLGFDFITDSSWDFKVIKSSFKQTLRDQSNANSLQSSREIWHFEMGNLTSSL